MAGKKQKHKVSKVLSEFKAGTQKVKKRSQAIAIGLSEAGLSRKKKRRK